MKINLILIDNYDSFTYNLYQLIASRPDVEVKVFRNDKITIEELQEIDPDGIVISPGPGNPSCEDDFGVCTQIIVKLSTSIPILGVCLGHQGMGLLLGGNVINADDILHGKTSKINHTGTGLFEGIPQNISVARYHSLILEYESIPNNIDITAFTNKSEVMAIQHKKYPLFGVQFHPESFLTEFGENMINNFLAIVKEQISLHNLELIQ